MEFIYVVVAFAAIGGGMLAFALFKMPRRRDGVAAEVAVRHAADSPEINFSKVKVSGIGGLGLVVMSVVVALDNPSIRWKMAAAILFGAIMAIGLILARRKHPLPSSDASAGANTTLRIDE